MLVKGRKRCDNLQIN